LFFLDFSLCTMKHFLLLTFILFVWMSACPAQDTLFFDDFESGTSNWIYSIDWGLTTEFAHSPDHSFTDSPGSNYSSNLESVAMFANGVDLTGYTTANLVFRAIFCLEDGFDVVYVEASKNDFESYTTLAILMGENEIDTLTEWSVYSFSLDAFLNEPNVKIRFFFQSDPYVEYDGIYIDDVEIINSVFDNQAPVISYNAPKLYEGSIGPFYTLTGLIDGSGIRNTWLNYKVDGIQQPDTVYGIYNGLGSYSSETLWGYTIPEQSAGTLVEYWITAVDSSANFNVFVSDTFKIIFGNYILYDDGFPNFYRITGPESSNPGTTSWAVRISIPETAPNLVYALIRNYADNTHPNSPMLVHIWDADSLGGVGDELITPFLIDAESDSVHNDLFTRIDLRPWAAQLMNQTGDIYIGYSVPAGVVNLLVDYPFTELRSWYYNGTEWFQSNADYNIRAITGTNPLDAGVLSLLSPVSGTGLGNSEPVTVVMKNAGCSTLSNIPVGYTINGGTPVMDTVPGPLLPFDSLEFSFSVPADFSAFETFTLDVFTALSGDQNPANDHVITEIIHSHVMFCDTVNYDAKNHTGIGLTSGGTFTVAACYPASLASPHTGAGIEQIRVYLRNYPESVILKVWAAGTTAVPGQEVYSQDVSEEMHAGWNSFLLANPPFITGDDFWVGYVVTHYQGQHPAGIDAGPADSLGCWINTGGGWTVTIGHWNIRPILCQIADLNDVGVSALIHPVSGPSMSANEAVTVLVQNFGTLPQSDIPISLKLNGVVVLTDTIGDTIPPAGTLEYSFGGTADFSAFGNYTVEAFTHLSGDLSVFNNLYSCILIHNEFSECDTFHYDGPNAFSLGIDGALLTAAVHFPGDMLTWVAGGYIDYVDVFIADMPSACLLKIFDAGTSTSPGDEILNLDITSQIIPHSWNTIFLNQNLIPGPGGFWLGLQAYAPSGVKPFGTDAGPSLYNASWYSVTPGEWSHFPSYATTIGNWNLRVSICPVSAPEGRVEGNLVYDNAGQTPLPNSPVYLILDNAIVQQTTTDLNGNYAFPAVPGGNYIITAGTSLPFGGVNSVDALLIMKYFVGLEQLSGLRLQAANLNQDGSVNSIDALLAMKRFVGLISTFPISDWLFEGYPVSVQSSGIVQNIKALCAGDVNGSYVP
jgi:hypothetical protein